MDSLSEAVKTVQKKIDRYKGKSVGETNTKTALIDPILRALGWGVGDLEEVQQEYKMHRRDNPVDYALMLMNTPCLFVEAKALEHDLDDRKWANQIMNYANNAGVEWAVITNGDEYRIYNALAKVPIEGKLLRKVRITDESGAAEETLSLLSKERLKGNVLKDLWDAHFVDGKMKPALEGLFSADPDPSFVKLIKTRVQDLSTKDIEASLRRVRASFEFPFPPPDTGTTRKPPAKPESNFWESIRREGVFAGKPVSADYTWISKSVRGILLYLELQSHACRVSLHFKGEDRKDRRAKVMKLFPKTKYKYELHESSKCAVVRFPVLDKGKRDRDDWPEIRKKLTSVGEEIYNKIKESGF